MHTASPPTSAFAHPVAPGDPTGDDADALRLPEPAGPPRRTGVPLLAAGVPMAAAVGLWLITGTTSMLWFAALGPVIALAGLADASWAARRRARRDRREGGRLRERVGDAVTAAHQHERDRLWVRHPDVAHILRAAAGTAGGAALWRGRADGMPQVVLGCGSVRSNVRVSGGGSGDTALRRRAAVLTGAPLTAPLDDGIAVVGPDALTAAVVRALVLQLCLLLPPGRLAVRPSAPHEAWYDALPHARAVSADADARTVAVCPAGARPDRSADVVVAAVRPGVPVPPECRIVLTLTGVDTAHATGDGIDADVHVEAFGAGQAVRLAALLSSRAGELYGGTSDAPVDLRDLLSSAVDGAPDADAAHAGGLTAPIGRREQAPFLLDLVSDGPHAVLAGMTGSGKSELLTTWITAVCARNPPSRVSFLLADFKGGTAFDALADLPHVAGVITDLDGDGARRALQSLRAELRHREARLVQAGARDIDDTDLPRLVIVVDEYAALAASHPDLQALFVDVAARGRALGMHVVLGTQRAVGTFPEALLANCPLRISLRVADPADSRMLVGCDDAAHLPGDGSGRGLALVRRSADTVPCAVRIALCPRGLIADTAVRFDGARPRRPWLPALPTALPLADVRARAATHRDVDELILGLADEPERQRQTPVLLRAGERGLCAVGAPGTGRSTLMALVASQAHTSVTIGPDPEQAWDALCRLADEPVPDAVVLVDDVDALLARYPADYAQEAAALLERVIHSAGASATRVVLTAHRVNAATARIVDLVPRRALLATPSRAEHVAAGGDPHDWRDHRPPGRAVLDGHVVQFALPEPGATPDVVVTGREWLPSAGITGVVLRPGPLHRRVVAAARRARARIIAVDELAAVIQERAGRPPRRADRAVVAIGDADRWQREWRTLSQVRDAHDLLMDAAGPAEYRLLSGSRDLPPYCLPGRGRGWLLRAGQTSRVVVPMPDAPA